MKIMTIFFFELKTSFCSFPQFFCCNKVFPKYRAVMHNLIRVSSTVAKFREITGSSFKKSPWQMSGGKDRQTQFYRILPATARWLISTTAVNWHLKVKDQKCDIGPIKNYCITVSMQKLSSIHKLNQQILGSQELNDHAHFWPGPHKNYWNNY